MSFPITIHNYNLEKVFKNEPSRICGRQPLKKLKGYGPLKHTIFLQIFRRLSSTNFTWSILEYLITVVDPNEVFKKNLNLNMHEVDLGFSDSEYYVCGPRALKLSSPKCWCITTVYKDAMLSMGTFFSMYFFFFLWAEISLQIFLIPSISSISHCIW